MKINEVKMLVGVSSCLGFFNCRYDGKGFMDIDLDLLKVNLKCLLKTDDITLIPLCPEQLGGLPTPRVPAEITSGDGFDVLLGQARVVCSDGLDVTQAFLRGAQEVLNFALAQEIQCFVLKQNSPSCGCRNIYSGKFDGQKKKGKGVTAAILEQNNMVVYDENILNEG
jgi:uncharacterized protein YbbK (DUF523 family)